MSANKVQDSIDDAVMPLIELWKQECHLSQAETIVLYHKEFDFEKPNNETIQCILADKVDKRYMFYNVKIVARIYKSAKKKIYKYI